MKLQRTTLILLISAILLGGFVYFYEIKGAPQREAAKTTKQPIFSFEEDEIQSVIIYTDDETWQFERLSKPELGWQMKKPKNTPANDAAISFLLNLLAKGESDRTIFVTADKLKEYGLNRPSATVEVKLKGEKVHKLVLGKPDFNQSLLYAQADPSEQKSEALSVLLVPIDFQYAVSRPLSEWEGSKEDADASDESKTKEEYPNTKKESPNTKDESPDTKKESPDTKDESPDTKKESPDTKDESPDTKKESPNTKDESPDTKKESSDTKDESPDTKKESPNTKNESPDPKEKE